MNKMYVNDKISMMLECLLSKDDLNRNVCKRCCYADACCYLMEAVFVVHHVHYKERRTVDSPYVNKLDTPGKAFAIYDSQKK